jgi:hypothetical protein
LDLKKVLAPSKNNAKKTPLLSITFINSLKEVVAPLEKENKNPRLLTTLGQFA